MRSALEMHGDRDGGEVNVHRIGNVHRVAARHHDRDRQASRAAEIQNHSIPRATLPSTARAGRADHRDKDRRRRGLRRFLLPVRRDRLRWWRQPSAASVRPSATSTETRSGASRRARVHLRPPAANSQRHGRAGFPHRSPHAARATPRLRITPPASRAGAEVSTSASGTDGQAVAAGRSGRCRRFSRRE